MSTVVPVSVIMPSYNSEATIERALKSIFDQAVLPAEVVVVDDCSVDGTVALVASIAAAAPVRVELIALNKNQGAANARNVGLDAASSPVVAFLDSDDAWHRRKIEVQYELLKNDQQLFLISHRWILLEDVLQLNDLPIARHAATPISFGRLLYKNYFNTSTVMMRATPLRFDKNLRHSEDYDFWLAIAASGLKLARISEPLAAAFKGFYGESGLSRSLWRMESGELGCYRRLRSSGRIKTGQFMLACAFSLIKFASRVIRVWTRKFVRG